MYLLPKIHKRVYDVPGWPVTSNCDAPTYFMHKIREIKDIPNDALTVTADVEGLYPSILNKAGLQALNEVLKWRKDKKISTNGLVKMAAFVLQNN